MAAQTTIPIVVNGACGKMGREVIKAVTAAEDLTLVGAIDKNPAMQGQDIGEIAGCGPVEIPITSDLEATLVMAQSEGLAVMVDFTHPDTVYNSVRAAIAYGVRPVVGTTGLSNAQIKDLAEFAEKASIGCLIIPNFSIGVVLMQQAAQQAAQYFEHVEIIELHHNQKADAPSGTALKFGELIAEEFEGILETVETVQKLGDVVQQLPTDEMDFDIRTFADATVWTPEPGDTLSHIRRMESVWFDADRRRLLGSTLGPASFDDRREQARRDYDRLEQMEVETIVSEAMLEQGMSDPEIRRMTAEHWDPEHMRAYLYDGPIPLILAIADNTAMLAPTDENGIPTAVVETENETIRSWVDAEIDAYRGQSSL